MGDNSGNARCIYNAVRGLIIQGLIVIYSTRPSSVLEDVLHLTSMTCNIPY
jgi:hypothetical protein